MRVITLKYSNTNTYLIEGERGTVLFDTGWTGTFTALCKALGEEKKKLQDIDYVFISHFHPDHMGIAQEIADKGPTIVAIDLQVPYLHSSDAILSKDNKNYHPIVDDDIKVISVSESRSLLATLGIDGEVIYTPGHSDDSVSLWLDNGCLFVGDLNPLYELEMYKGSDIEKSWNRLLGMNPSIIYYGHAKAKMMDDSIEEVYDNKDLYRLVSRVIKFIDKGYSIEKICRKTDADKGIIEDINRMYLTHQNVGVQGILDRIEIKNK